jgi:hypothetical protein
MFNESNDNGERVSNEQLTANQEASHQPHQDHDGVELKKRELLKMLAKGAFVVPATLAILTKASAAFSGPQ